MTKDGARAAARAKAAAEREAAARRARRLRIGLIAAGVVVVLGIAGGAVAAVSSTSPAAPAATASGSGASVSDPAFAAATAGRTSSPPWAAPTEVEAAVRAAGLTMLTAEGTALHIHQHLSITVDGKAVQVPAYLGIDEAAERISALHTHDTSGILHVESPVQRTFHLDQAFAEWDVRLAPGALGPWVAGRDGVRIGVFVNGHPYTGDPRRIVLGSRQDVDFVVTTDGSAPVAPKPFTFPAGY